MDVVKKGAEAAVVVFQVLKAIGWPYVARV